MDVYNILRRRLITAHSFSRLINSLSAWAEKIVDDGGWAHIDTTVFDHKTNKYDGWSFCFATSCRDRLGEVWKADCLHGLDTQHLHGQDCKGEGLPFSLLWCAVASLDKECLLHS